MLLVDRTNNEPPTVNEFGTSGTERNRTVDISTELLHTPRWESWSLCVMILSCVLIILFCWSRWNRIPTNRSLYRPQTKRSKVSLIYPFDPAVTAISSSLPSIEMVFIGFEIKKRLPGALSSNGALIWSPLPWRYDYGGKKPIVTLMFFYFNWKLRDEDQMTEIMRFETWDSKGLAVTVPWSKITDWTTFTSLVVLQ